jgi:hypothetical protein
VQPSIAGREQRLVVTSEMTKHDVTVRPARADMVGAQAAVPGSAYEVQLHDAILQVVPQAAQWNKYPDQLVQAEVDGTLRDLQVCGITHYFWL